MSLTQQDYKIICAQHECVTHTVNIEKEPRSSTHKDDTDVLNYIYDKHYILCGICDLL